MPRAAAAALLALAATAAAQQTSVNPMPSLTASNFVITPSAILTPWTNGASAMEGSSTAIGNSVARLTYGPCVYRTAHWHAFAWELLTPTSPTLALTSVMESPSNAPGGGNQLLTVIIQPGQSITYPAGYMHYQFNDNCDPIDAVLVWNAVSSGGTNNAPQQMAALPVSFTNAAYTSPLPAPAGGAGTWVVDAACAARCGLPTNGTTKADVLKAKLQTAAGLIPAGEQVAAATAAALFGKGVLESAKGGVRDVIASVGANKTG